MTSPEPRIEVRTMNPGRPNAFDRVFLFCPDGHDAGSSPVTNHTGRRWLSGDLSGESCGRVGCRWES